jgi:hypothetical protein
MMKPDPKLITIRDNVNQIKRLLDELVLRPRIGAIKWSNVTKQTPNIKVGYPGQHLASLITGMEGERTGARGKDLRDGSEVKSCSRIDQMDRCKEKECGASVSRSELRCPACDSDNIDRKEDSKWLFTVRTEADLAHLTHTVPRVVLILGDYPNFGNHDFDTLRFEAFEIWPRHLRHRNFAKIMSHYYNEIYLKNRQKNPEKVPAPKNFWPDKIGFYMCNPIRTFSCIVSDSRTKPKIDIKHYIEPTLDRSDYDSILMPATLLNRRETEALIDSVPLSQLNEATKNPVSSRQDLKRVLRGQGLRKFISNTFTDIDEKLRDYLQLRFD